MKHPQGDPIYESTFIGSLFDEMAETYGRVNLVSSFGFAWRWRKQCAERLSVKGHNSVYDLMSGMGEMWEHMADKSKKIVAIDLSRKMCDAAREHQRNFKDVPIEIIHGDALDERYIAEESADIVISSFGLKTL
ncbi:MAG: class I SAM-dependent methyltransferase, partial [Verrucomicrobiota bacterium]